MSSWREIERFRKDPDGFRALAGRLLSNVDLSEWESIFVESIAGRTGTREFTTRQSETLLEIRDNAVSVEVSHGFNVSSLIRGVYEARLDLSEADEEWIVAIRNVSTTSIKRRHIGRLFRCARQLGLIDDPGPT